MVEKGVFLGQWSFISIWEGAGLVVSSDKKDFFHQKTFHVFFSSRGGRGFKATCIFLESEGGLGADAI